MTRRFMEMGALVSVLVGFLVAGSPPAAAAPASQFCSTLNALGLKLEFATLGTGFTCAAAKTWIVKLTAEKVTAGGGEVPLADGPKGFHCYATFEVKGHPSDGFCEKGKLASPSSGFNWGRGG
jgi:hypothetical protein